ncbi:MAG: hypothetical protein HC771_06375 [Synechococcales cyanobacterium CRU_2_2]|nr:hypothetical protein [Synechococcales cyanobacterium CRU_2_2]
MDNDVEINIAKLSKLNHGLGTLHVHGFDAIDKGQKFLSLKVGDSFVLKTLTKGVQTGLVLGGEAALNDSRQTFVRGLSGGPKVQH